MAASCKFRPELLEANFKNYYRIGHRGRSEWIFHTGAPYSAQFTMSSSANIHCTPQNTQTRPPPYRFDVVDLHDVPVKTYKEQLYKIRLTGLVPFQGLLIQVRPSTREGYPIGHLRAGEFVPDLTWSSQGLQIQPCPSTFNDSITHTSKDEKMALEVLWKPTKNYGPVLFVITIVQTRFVFWTQWLPPSGFLLPEEQSFKSGGDSKEEGKSQSQNSLNRKIPLSVIKRPHRGNFQSTAAPEIEVTTESTGGSAVGKQFPSIVVTSGPLDVVTDGAQRLSRITPEVTLQELRTSTISTSERPVITTLSTISTSEWPVFTTKIADSRVDTRTAAPTTLADSRVEIRTTSPEVEITTPAQTSNSIRVSTTFSPPEHAAISSRTLFDLRTVATTTPTDVVITTAPQTFVQSRVVITTDQPRAIITTDQPGVVITTTEEIRQQRPLAGKTSPEVLEGLNILKGKNGTQVTDYCIDFPCFNNGTCKNIPEEDRYECFCTSRWIGKQCENENYCENNKCQYDADCVSGDDEGQYKCKCKKEWAGEFCERSCPSYLCDNGGTCILVDRGKGYGCLCAPGWTGERCRAELDLCTSQPCLRGGTCTHQFNAFQCKCVAGYMGTTCHRPCQDIYGSCAVWNEEERCETMRQSTKFFDLNCASTCKQCIYDNRTLLAEVPLPPVLEPFDFILGRWTLNTSTQHRFPIEFTSNSTAGYHEEMLFMAMPVTMFGTQSVNYSSVARNNRDPSDVPVNVGFLTLKPLTKPLKISLMSTGNDGITTIEEGFLNGTELNLITQYLAILPSVDMKAPALVKRVFSITNEFYLRETVERLGNNGQKDYFTKYYYKEKKFAPF